VGVSVFVGVGVRVNTAVGVRDTVGLDVAVCIDVGVSRIGDGCIGAEATTACVGVGDNVGSGEGSTITVGRGCEGVHAERTTMISMLRRA
jgi:hypothetical protein